MSDTVYRPVVLIVDDNAMIRNMLEVALSGTGFDVRTAGTGAQALAVARSVRSTLAVAILDVRLLGEQGPDVLRQLRTVVPNLPCCFITGDMGDVTEEELLAEGAPVRVFSKPFPLPELVATVRELASVARN